MKTLFILVGMSAWISLIDQEIGTALALGFGLLLGIGCMFCEDDEGLFSQDDDE